MHRHAVLSKRCSVHHLATIGRENSKPLPCEHVQTEVPRSRTHLLHCAYVSASHRYAARRGYDRLAPPTIRMKGQLCAAAGPVANTGLRAIPTGRPVLYRQQSLANRIDPQRRSLSQVTSNGYARLLAQLAPVLGGAFCAWGWVVSVEARSLHVVVWSDHSDADEEVAEAIARVLTRYAVDFKSGLEVTFPQDGINVTYVAKPAINLASAVRAARMPPGALRLDVPAAARAA